MGDSKEDNGSRVYGRSSKTNDNTFVNLESEMSTKRLLNSNLQFDIQMKGDIDF